MGKIIWCIVFIIAIIVYIPAVCIEAAIRIRRKIIGKWKRRRRR